MNTTLAILMSAIMAVESGGRADAIGDDGDAVGCLQIHAACVEDVNRITGKAYTLADREDPEKSAEIFTAYVRHYGRAYERRTGRRATAQVYARIWNGGPKGYSKNATRKYWRKVQTQLANRN